MIETILFGCVLLAMYFLNGSAVIPAMTGAAAAAALLAAAAFFALRENAARAKSLAASAGVLALAAGLVYGAMYLNAGKAYRGARKIAAACEAYKAKHGAYPEKISALVPDYLRRAPRARAVVMWGQYRLRDGKVMYALEPWMMIAAYYDLEARKTGFARMDEMLTEKRD